MLTLQRTLNLRQARRHPTRTALMVLSIALGVAAWIATHLLDRSLGTALKSSATPLGGLADLQVSNGDIGVAHALAAPLAAIPGVRSVRPVLIERVILPGLGGRSAVLVGAEMMGQAPQELAGVLGLTIEGGSPAAYLKALVRRENPALVGDALGKELPGAGARLDVVAAGKARRVTRIGTIAARRAGPAVVLGGHVLLTDLRVAAALTGRSDRVSRIDVSLDPAADRAAVRRRLESAVAGGGQVITPEASDRRAAEALAGLRLGFSLCGYGALGLGLFLIASTLGVVAAERRGEIGALRALGADRGQVWRLFLGEAVLLGLLGAAPGIPLGWGLARLGLGPLLRALSDVYLPLEAQGLALDPLTIIGGGLAGVITTLLAAFLPTARAALQTPVEAMSREPADAAGSSASLLLLAAVTLLSLAAAGFALGGRLPASYRSFGPLLLALVGTVLALPAVTALATRALRPVVEVVLGLPGRLAADYLIRTPCRSGFVVAALAGGMALILQTGGVIHGNAEAVRDWIDRCMMGDLFVTSGGPLSASGQIVPMRDELGPRIEAEFPGAYAVPMRFHMLPWRLAGSETRVRLLAMDVARYVAANRHAPPPDLDIYARLAAPGTVVVSENFAALYGVETGMTVALPGSQGPVPLRVAGVVTDFSCSRGTVIVDRARYGEAFEGGGVDVFSVFRPPATTLSDEAIRRRIEQSSWAAEQGLCVLTRPELRRHILGMIDRLYAVAYIQEVVAAVVAALGVATTLLISLLQRRRELGLLRALGATPGQARQIVLAEAALLTLLGLLFGLLIGAALEWYVLRVILLDETGFVFPFRFPWAHAALVAALVALSGGFAGLGPALRASRLKIHEAIAFE